MQELKQCPFCGSTKVKVFSYSEGGVCAKCLNCSCQTQAYTDFSIANALEKSAVEKVIEAWNRRV